MREHVRNEVRRLGASIIESKEFMSAYNETHHNATSVAKHSEDVACTSIRICRLLEKFGISVNHQDMVNAALCHDLGMLDRNEKYESVKACHKEHPMESVSVAKSILADYNDNVEDAISNHMWPVTGSFPKSKEGRVIVVADKYCAMKDLRHIMRLYLALVLLRIGIILP
ncbi:MAG: HD domain-containing protein [Lachnospiraceae bacterium]|nr:HD domain-containing protein [Lachnospiraceae bacterium]